MDKIRFLMSDTGSQVTAMCVRALEEKNIAVTVCEKEGNRVLEAKLKQQPDVVLLDAFMPGLEAVTVKPRYEATCQRKTVVLVTGAFQSEEVEQILLDNGFAFFLMMSMISSEVTSSSHTRLRSLVSAGYFGRALYLRSSPRASNSFGISNSAQ